MLLSGEEISASRCGLPPRQSCAKLTEGAESDLVPICPPVSPTSRVSTRPVGVRVVDDDARAGALRPLAALHASIQDVDFDGDESCPAFHAERLELTGAKPQAERPG